MHSVCLSVCPSVSTLTPVNNLQMSWNWSVLFTSNIAWTRLKMVCIRLLVHLQRHTKVFPIHYDLWGGEICLKPVLTNLYSIKYNKINIGHSNIQKQSMFPIKSTNILYPGSHWNFPIYVLRRKFFKAYFNIFIYQ